MRQGGVWAAGCGIAVVGCRAWGAIGKQQWHCGVSVMESTERVKRALCSELANTQREAPRGQEGQGQAHEKRREARGGQGARESPSEAKTAPQGRQKAKAG